MSAAFRWKLGYSMPWNARWDVNSLKALVPDYVKAGVDCVEAAVCWEWNVPKYTLHGEAMRRVIGAWQDGGVEVWSVHVPAGRTIDLSRPEYAPAGIELTAGYMAVCADMGVDRIVLHASSEPYRPWERAERIRVAQDSVRALYRKDVQIAVETLPRTCLCNTAEETVAFLEPLRGIAGCCVDVNHCQKVSPQDTIRAVGGRLITVHISDDDGVDERHWYPGEGVLNWAEILKALRAVDYRGCFLYELAQPFDHPARIRRNYDMLLERYGG